MQEENAGHAPLKSSKSLRNVVMMGSQSEEEIAEKWRKMKIEGQQQFHIMVASEIEDSDEILKAALAKDDEEV